MTTDPLESYAQVIYYVQKILGERIDGEYPVSRLLVQIEMIKKDPEFKQSSLKKNPKRFR